MSGKKPSDKDPSDKKPARSRWAADDEDAAPSFSNGNLTPAEMQARMAAADYGSARQHQLSTAMSRNQKPVTTNQNYIHAVRDCNIAGTEAADNAQANKAKTQKWREVEELKDGDEDGKPDIAGGQTHRERIRLELREAENADSPGLVNRGDARQLHGPTRLMTPARVSPHPALRANTVAVNSFEIDKDGHELGPLTDDEWKELKQIYDELGVAQSKPRTLEERAAARELLYRRESRRSGRRGRHPSSSSSASLRSRPVRAAPVNHEWAPQNLVVNPTPPLNLSNPAVTVTTEEMRRRLGSNFIELTEHETAVPTHYNTPQPVREPFSRPANPFNHAEPSMLSLEKDMQLLYGSTGVETAVVEASIASARSNSPPSNPFSTPSPPIRQRKTTPASTPVDAVEKVNTDSDSDALVNLVDGKLRHFHITKRYQALEPPIPEEPEPSPEADLIQFEEEARDLLDTITADIPPPPLVPTVATPPSPVLSIIAEPVTSVSEGTQTDDAGVTATPSAIAAAHTAPLPYMGPTSATHQEILASQDAFWAQQDRRRQGNPFTPSGAPRRSSLNGSRWATHIPPTNDNA